MSFSITFLCLGNIIHSHIISKHHFISFDSVITPKTTNQSQMTSSSKCEHKANLQSKPTFSSLKQQKKNSYSCREQQSTSFVYGAQDSSIVLACGCFREIPLSNPPCAFNMLHNGKAGQSIWLTNGNISPRFLFSLLEPFGLLILKSLVLCVSLDSIISLRKKEPRIQNLALRCLTK